MKHHRRSIAVLRWMGSGAIVMGLMGELGGMEAGAVASVMRVSQQQIVEASSGRAAFDEGMQLYEQQTTESLRAAIIKFEEAVKLFRAEKNSAGMATALHNMGRVYDDLGEKQKALMYYDQALLLLRALGDRAGEATTLNDIGAVYHDIGKKEKPLEYGTVN